MTDNAVRLFPLPDSPTIQVVLPAASEKETSFTSNLSGAPTGETVSPSILSSSLNFAPGVS